MTDITHCEHGKPFNWECSLCGRYAVATTSTATPAPDAPPSASGLLPELPKNANALDWEDTHWYWQETDSIGQAAMCEANALRAHCRALAQERDEAVQRAEGAEREVERANSQVLSIKHAQVLAERERDEERAKVEMLRDDLVGKRTSLAEAVGLLENVAMPFPEGWLLARNDFLSRHAKPAEHTERLGDAVDSTIYALSTIHAEQAECDGSGRFWMDGTVEIGTCDGCRKCKPCKTCGGSKRVEAPNPQFTRPCPSCNGTGKEKPHEAE